MAGEKPVKKANGGVSYSGDFSSPNYATMYYEGLPKLGALGQFLGGFFPNPATTGAYDSYMKNLASSISTPEPAKPYIATAAPQASFDPAIKPMTPSNVDFAKYGLGHNLMTGPMQAPPVTGMVQPTEKADGGFLSGPDYLSTGEVASPTNWGDPDSASDFFKADRAMRLAREIEGQKDIPLPPRRPPPVSEEAVEAAPALRKPAAARVEPENIPLSNMPTIPGASAPLPSTFQPTPIPPKVVATMPVDGKLTDRAPQDVGGAEEVWQRMLKQESGGRQFDKYGRTITSPAGALGISQVMPTTGPEAAKLAGLPWDLNRLKMDAEYNHALGRAYFDAQLAKYGDPILAAAAYNGGPGRVDQALALARQTGRPWTSFMKPETQNYVRVVGRAEGGEVDEYAGGGKTVSKALKAVSELFDSPGMTKWREKSVIPASSMEDRYFTGTSKDKDFANFNVGRHGAWFTKDPAEASSYALQNDSKGYRRDGWDMVPVNTADRVIPAFLRAENPYRGPLPESVITDNYKKAQSDWFDTLRAKGHDAWMPENSPNLAVILKNPTDIKSAISNSGDFDLTAPRIDRAEGGEVDDALHMLRHHYATDGYVDSNRAMREAIASIDPERSADQPVMDPEKMGEAWDRARRNYQNFPVQEGEATARAFVPSVRQEIGEVIGGEGGGRSYGSELRRRAADALVGSSGLDTGMGVVDFVPYAGQALGATDIAHDINQGDYAGAAEGAIVPLAMTAAQRFSGPAAAAGRRAVEIAKEYARPAAATAAGVAGLTAAPDEAEAAISFLRAMKLNTARNLPKDEKFLTAVKNTPHAVIQDEHLVIPVTRNQRTEQAGEPSVRGGVFYLPAGSSSQRYYTGSGHNFMYGGPEQFAEEMAVSNPLFVKGATGGKAPEEAYSYLMGKPAFKEMQSDVMRSLGGYYLPKDIKHELISEFVEKHAPSMTGLEYYILQNSSKGNQLRYALQEAAAAEAARKSGHDAIIGYSTSRTKGPFLSELFDVREKTYPSKSELTEIWPQFLSQEEKK